MGDQAAKYGEATLQSYEARRQRIVEQIAMSSKLRREQLEQVQGQK